MISGTPSEKDNLNDYPQSDLIGSLTPPLRSSPSSRGYHCMRDFAIKCDRKVLLQIRLPLNSRGVPEGGGVLPPLGLLADNHKK